MWKYIKYSKREQLSPQLNEKIFQLIFTGYKLACWILKNQKINWFTNLIERTRLDLIKNIFILLGWIKGFTIFLVT